MSLLPVDQRDLTLLTHAVSNRAMCLCEMGLAIEAEEALKAVLDNQQAPLPSELATVLHRTLAAVREISKQKQLKGCLVKNLDSNDMRVLEAKLLLRLKPSQDNAQLRQEIKQGKAVAAKKRKEQKSREENANVVEIPLEENPKFMKWIEERCVNRKWAKMLMAIPPVPIETKKQIENKQELDVDVRGHGSNDSSAEVRLRVERNRSEAETFLAPAGEAVSDMVEPLECGICFNEPDVLKLPCWKDGFDGHVICVRCLADWRAQCSSKNEKTCCPHCRRNIPDGVIAAFLGKKPTRRRKTALLERSRLQKR